MPQVATPPRETQAVRPGGAPSARAVSSRRSTTAKIKPLRELAGVVERLKAGGKRIVQCHGVFDLLHPGHIRHFEAAKREGNVLVVTVTPDRYVHKGPGRPFFNQSLRAESLAALACVDYVAINEWPTAVEAIQLLKPDVYAKGSDYAKPQLDITGKISEEAAAVQSVGGRLHVTDEVTFSSSRLINDAFSVFPPKTEQWLRTFKRRFSIDQVTEFLDSASTMKVLVVGEAILDEYVFCEGLGKSTKDPVLAFRYHSTETYAGGSFAVANHLAGFCGEVRLVTLLGESERREEVVRPMLKANVHPQFVTWHEAPTIHKRRFVDTHTSARMFELYVMDDRPLPSDVEKGILKALRQQLPDYDLVVVPDYGHGMMTPAVIKTLCERARFLAINTQANAGNRGFNTVSKYPRADYVCLAGHEIALETRMRHAEMRELVLEVAKRIACPRFTVTMGKGGSLHYQAEDGFTETPALAGHVMDRVGAGDAVLAVTSLLVVHQAPWEVVGFIGNIAGALMVADLGNRMTVDKVSITKSVMSLMK